MPGLIIASISAVRRIRIPIDQGSAEKLGHVQSCEGVTNREFKFAPP